MPTLKTLDAEEARMHRHTRARRLAALGATVAAAAVALPATAEAAYTGAVSGTQVTLTGNDDADALTIGETGGFLTHTLSGFNSNTDFDSTVAGNQQVAADDTFTFTINAGGGDDTITITSVRLAAGSTFDGQAGNDAITGNDPAENLRGGDGDDRLVGARGNDDVEGGAGADVLVWNNGDGSDAMDGDAGADAVEVNGALTQGDVFTVVPNAARVRFDRTNLGPFTLDIGAVERLGVNGFGGGDTITGASGLAPLILLALDGGQGADAITGGDGPDLILGGDDVDTLAGAAGDDRVVGDRGDDVMGGGPGDDALVWNNGDGSDRMDGDDGVDRVEVNGSPTAGDAFTIGPNGARARFDRTNLGPFTLDIGATEALDLRGAGGDDSLTVAAGTAALLAVIADGGSGNDTLTGAEGDDTFLGGSGDDVLTGGGGSDLADGQAGNDRLALRDSAADLGRGGPGTDTAVADAAGTDALIGVETVDRPAAADTVATAARVRTGAASVRVRNRRTTVRLSVECPAAETGGCTGRVILTGRVRAGGRRVTAVLGTARFALAAGGRRTLTVRLATGLRRLAATSRLTARAQTISRDAAGNVAERTRSVRLRLPRGS